MSKVLTMINKFLLLIMFLMWILWAGDYFYFRHAGARFTATDGQTLCMIIKDVAKHSHGYQQSGKVLPECRYDTE